MKVLIAIPSLGRADNIITLKNNLLKGFYGDVKIIVPHNQVSHYEQSIEYNKYDDECLIDVVGCGEQGIGATRTFILNEYHKNYDYIVMIDDDIEKLSRVRHGAVVEKCHLRLWIKEAIKTLEERNAYFGGITLCPNIYYAKDTISNNLKYISGALQIYRSSERPIPQNYLRHFEDYYNCIEYFLRDGIICRWNGIIPTTKNYNPNGGICADYGSLAIRLKDAEKVAEELLENYGSKVLKIVHKKKSSRGPECVNLRLNNYFKCSPQVVPEED
jgi:hypothetical protein